MNKIFFLSLLLPTISYAEETTTTAHTFSTSGLVFLTISWTGIIVWNLICFSKLLKKH